MKEVNSNKAKTPHRHSQKPWPRPPRPGHPSSSPPYSPPHPVSSPLLPLLPPLPTSLPVHYTVSLTHAHLGPDLEHQHLRRRAGLHSRRAVTARVRRCSRAGGVERLGWLALVQEDFDRLR
jgi:hypothetical protein